MTNILTTPRHHHNKTIAQSIRTMTQWYRINRWLWLILQWL